MEVGIYPATCATHEHAFHLYTQEEVDRSVQTTDVEPRALELGLGWGYLRASLRNPSLYKFKEDWDPEGEAGYRLVPWG